VLGWAAARESGLATKECDVASQAVDAAAIRAAVDIFYERMLADPALAPMFVGVHLSRLRAHQRAFLLQALGGPSLYSGRELQDAHSGLEITNEQFDLTVAHLLASLTTVGVADDVVDRATADIGALRGLIVD
jgi:hemoglobin